MHVSQLLWYFTSADLKHADKRTDKIPPKRKQTDANELSMRDIREGLGRRSTQSHNMENMAAGNQQETNNSKTCKKRRGTYLSYLSHPSLKVPRTSEYRQKVAKPCDKETNAAFHSDVVDHYESDCFSQGIEENSLNDCDDVDLLEEVGRPAETGSDREDLLIGGTIADETFKELLNSTLRTVERDSDVNSQDFPEDPALNTTYVTSEFHQDLNDRDDGMDELPETEDTNGSSTQDDYVKITELSSSQDTPLYAGSAVTFSVSLLLIITFAMRHNLSGLALADLLTLINVHLVVPNCFAKSTAVLNRFFRQLKKPIEYHYYCCFCYQYIGLKKTSCCSNKYCLADFSKKGALAYFIVLPLVAQLQSLLASK